MSALFHRGHYNIIASQIKHQIDRCEDQESRLVMIRLALSFANRLLEDNSNFDPERFLKACSDRFTLEMYWDSNGEY